MFSNTKWDKLEEHSRAQIPDRPDLGETIRILNPTLPHLLSCLPRGPHAPPLWETATLLTEQLPLAWVHSPPHEGAGHASDKSVISLHMPGPLNAAGNAFEGPREEEAAARAG